MIYPIDSAKSIYQRNCLTQRKGGNVKKEAEDSIFQPTDVSGFQGVSMGRSCVVNSIFFLLSNLSRSRLNALEDY